MIIVLSNQSLFDLAVQTAGSAEAAFALALQNNRCITDDLEAGLELRNVAIEHKGIEGYYSSKGLTPATSITTLDIALLGSIFDDTFDDTFYDTGQRVFDFTFNSSFE